jgi:hypothetical protein
MLDGFCGVIHAHRRLSTLHQLLGRGEGCRLIGDSFAQGRELAGSAG